MSFTWNLNVLLLYVISDGFSIFHYKIVHCYHREVGNVNFQVHVLCVILRSVHGKYIMILCDILGLSLFIPIRDCCTLQTVFASDLYSRNFLQLPKPVGVDFRAS